jgi:hypothetical protein
LEAPAVMAIVERCSSKCDVGIFLILTGVLIVLIARSGRKEATATEDFDFHISYL